MTSIFYLIESAVAFMSVILLNILACRGWHERGRSWHIFIFFFITVELMLACWLLLLALSPKPDIFVFINNILADGLRLLLSCLGLSYYIYKKKYITT